MNSLHLKKSRIYLLRQDSFLNFQQAGNDQLLQMPADLMNRFFGKKDDFIDILKPVETEFKKLNREEFLYLQPVRSKRSLVGFLALGEKKSESAYNKEDADILKILSTHIGTAYENIKLYEDFSEKERLQHEMQLARKIQLNSLPDPAPAFPSMDFAARLNPAAEVGGDYYDYFKLSEDRVAIFIGDVSGKGMPAALFMSRIQGILSSLRHLHSEPSRLLLELNHLLFREMPANSFFTLSYLLIDRKTHRYTAARAGHNEFLYWNSREKKMQSLKPSGLGLGLSDNGIFKNSLEIIEGKLQSGDFFMLYTDGITEARNPAGELYGDDRFMQIFEKYIESSAEHAVDAIIASVENFSDTRHQADDLTLIGIKIL